MGWRYGLAGDCDDEDLVLCGLNQGEDCFGFASERLQQDKKLMVTTVRQDSQNIEFIPSELVMEQGFLTELAATTQFEQHVKRLPKCLLPPHQTATDANNCSLQD